MTTPVDRLAQALKDRYTIERELGAGGMATVYLAEDPKHHRKVALKVLRPDLAATLGPERFLREVTIAANLQHPHILPVYDSGDVDGFLYYVMPYVDGESLRDRLAKHGELPLTDAVRILRDVADAMAAAHAKGVVHRDIKPENIMLSGRHALVADFGVAKAVSEATGRQTLTTAGVALGTPTYMAPEQAAADPHTDHRADLYAFGVMAYEMVTGQPPFVGATPQAVLAAHVTEAPVNVTQRRTMIPQPLAQLIMRCLAKKPADRPQSAEELLPVLEGLGTPSGGITPTYTQPVQAVPTGGRKRWPLMAAAAVVVVGLGAAGLLLFGSGGDKAPAGDVREPVVVIPFEVQATDAQLANLGHQAADQISAAISQARLGAVVPYRATGGAEAEAFSPEVARRVVAATGAATLVTGVIYQRGDSLEMRAQVLRAGDLKVLFSLTTERGPTTSPARPLAATTQRVLGAVGLYLSPMARGYDVTLNHPPSSLETFRLFDKADELFRQTGGDSATRALLIEALRLDSTHYWSALNLAASYWNYGFLRASDSILAHLEARRTRLTVGEALYLDWSKAAGSSPEEEYRAAIAGFQVDSLGWAYAVLYSCVRANRPEEALRYYALRDTATVWGRDWQAWDTQAARAYHALGRFEEELALAQAARARQPRSYGHLASEVRALAAMGRTEELEPRLAESAALEWPLAKGALMQAIATELSSHGRPDGAATMALRLLDWIAEHPEDAQNNVNVANWGNRALRVLGRRTELRAAYAARAREPEKWRVLNWPPATIRATYEVLVAEASVRIGDTTGALQLARDLRSQRAPVAQMITEADGSCAWCPRHAANILAALDRKDDAVAALREWLNLGGRMDADFARPAPYSDFFEMRDYPPFQELVRLRN